MVVMAGFWSRVRAMITGHVDAQKSGQTIAAADGAGRVRRADWRARMKPISRRRLLTGGLAATAGVGGLAVADRRARRYGLIPPDCGGFYGPGETSTPRRSKNSDDAFARPAVSALG